MQKTASRLRLASWSQLNRIDGQSRRGPWLCDVHGWGCCTDNGSVTCTWQCVGTWKVEV